MTTTEPDAPAQTPSIDIDALQQALLAWWDRDHRDLPWRRTNDPYAILVSETMLQQTQAERVVPKYESFLRRFPTLAALAEAPAAEVIRAWAGLGYNRRAVNLHHLAGVVVRTHDGRLPEEVDGLLALPGIGPYTARAVASIAFGRLAAVVDTNVRRVLTRIVDGGQAERSPGEVQALADGLLARDHPGDWNQTLMELGARICTSTPRCGECPVQRLCAAAPGIREIREAGGRYRAPRMAKPQGTFAGSTRFYRGRVVDILRADADGEGLVPVEIGRRLRLDFGAADRPWLESLLAGLARDRLIEWRGGEAPARLPR